MTRRMVLTLALGIQLALAGAVQAQSRLNVVTTTEDLASIAREVGGDRVTAESIARGYQDPHFVEAKPSFILRLQRADLLVAVGRELEIGWLPPLIQQSRNAKIQPGSNGYLDASLQAKILDIPQGQVTRAMGDVHPLGNPHYWLDPENGGIVARSIAAKLAELQPGDKAYFNQRLTDFLDRLSQATKRWTDLMAPYKGMKVVTYHRSFPNFADRFGLDVIGYVEPRPGIPPTPQHTLDLIHEMRQQNVKVLIVEPYFDLEDAQRDRARDRGAAGRPGAVGRRCQGDHRLLQAFRLRSQPPGERHQAERVEVRPSWTR